MSRRHRTDEVAAARAEIRAHARGERHRIHSELHAVAAQVEAGVEPDDVIDPGPNWKPEHHPHVAKATGVGASRFRHWKVKDWKRRTLRRRARARALLQLASD